MGIKYFGRSGLVLRGTAPTGLSASPGYGERLFFSREEGKQADEEVDDIDIDI